MTTKPNAPAGPVRAQPPAGSAAQVGPGEVLFAGRARHSVKVGAYFGWGLLTAALVAGGIGLQKIEALSRWPMWLLGVVGLIGLAHTYLRHVTTTYKVSTRRIEFERGIIGKEVDSLELWRILDVTFQQSPLDRILGNAKIKLMSTDQSTPELVLHGLPNARKLFENLREAVQVARHTSRPMELVGQDGAMELS